VLLGDLMKITAFAVLLAVLAVSVYSATIHVPADQPTIQAGRDHGPDNYDSIHSATYMFNGGPAPVGCL